ncbi:hypothetical protein Bca4012_016019 [Brassica carinata]|uniref:Uncharacterized protein n=1 Tax=Brassica carinata TaxID=52824 RepID=A0A8X7WS49_BRACI|nr:hypothetical protein Bca52824_006216 [Brassica carinata]
MLGWVVVETFYALSGLLQTRISIVEHRRSVQYHCDKPRLMMNLVSSSDVDTRDASLRGLLALAKARKCCTCGSSIEKGDEKLRQILEDRIKAISLMSEEDRSAAEEERQLLDSLWITLLA